jgi:NADPH:quinone reductase-like Zn-dependent oxidoreductase
MRAVVARQYGGPEILAVEDVPVPRPGSGQILVRIRAAALNPADLRTLSGVLRELAPLTFPHVPGSDFAGTVAEAGPDAAGFAEGDEVFGTGLPRATAAMAAMLSTPPSLTTGAMAAYAVFEASTPAITRRPDGLRADHAASLSIPGLTALAVLRAGQFEPIATALPEDDAYIRDLGAADVIDYRTADTIAETLRRHPGGVDAMVNLALPGPVLVDAGRAIRPRGPPSQRRLPEPRSLRVRRRQPDGQHRLQQRAARRPRPTRGPGNEQDPPTHYHQVIPMNVGTRARNSSCPMFGAAASWPPRLAQSCTMSE